MFRFMRRHVGILLTVSISSTFFELLPPQVVRPRVVLSEHEARIVQFSPDGRVPSEGFTPDGSRAVIATWDHTSRWMPPGRRHDNSVVAVFDPPESKARVKVAETEVHQATISPNGRILALPSDRKDAIPRQGIDAVVSRLRGALGLAPTMVDFGVNPPTVEVHEIRFLDAATGEFVGTIDRPARRDPERPSDTPERTPYATTFSPDGKTLIVRYLPADFEGWSSRNPMINWSVELWDIPSGRRIDESHSTAAILAAILLVFAGAWLDRRRARRAEADDRAVTGQIDSGMMTRPRQAGSPDSRD